MSLIPWAIIALMSVGLIIGYRLWKSAAREHYSSVHYAIHLLLDPAYYESEKTFFFDQIRKRREISPEQLSVAMFSGLSVHAERIFSTEGTAYNQQILWRIFKGFHSNKY